MSSSVKRSRIGIKSDWWRIVIEFGQAIWCNSAFVRGELRPVYKTPYRPSNFLNDDFTRFSTHPRSRSPPESRVVLRTKHQHEEQAREHRTSCETKTPQAGEAGILSPKNGKGVNMVYLINRPPFSAIYFFPETKNNSQFHPLKLFFSLHNNRVFCPVSSLSHILLQMCCILFKIRTIRRFWPNRCLLLLS